MFNKVNVNIGKKKLFVYIVLTAMTIAVFWQVAKFDFVVMDDNVYVTDNSNIQSGITPDRIRWAFSTTYAEFWHPMTWLSLMFDYQLYGLNAGGYHLTNLILHVLSTLLLFWLFDRMTKEIWKSAFVAALFALHPLHVESVAWIAERKDVLSVFFGMLTLCLYVYYTEKPAVIRYLLVVISFILAIMSKPMVVTLPVVMILLDYWPLSRFSTGIDSRGKNVVLWQLKEKTIFFVLSAVFSIVAIYAQPKLPIEGWPFSLESRLVNAIISFIVYLKKTFWPFNLSVFYLFFNQAHLGQIVGAVSLILIISVFVILIMKRLPYVFVGWLWYAIALLPIIGIIPAGNNAMADRYAYLPSIGIFIILAWGAPRLFDKTKVRKAILFPVSIILLAFLSVLTWQQCGYWKNGIELFSHASQVTKSNPLVYIALGRTLEKEKKYNEAIDNYYKAIHMVPQTQDNVISYDERGLAGNKINQFAHIGIGRALAEEGKYDEAIDHYNKAINMTPITPDHITAYNKRGVAYSKTGRSQRAIEDFNKAISLDHDSVDAYLNRGITFAEHGRYERALMDFNEAMRLKPNSADAYYNRGVAYTDLKRHQNAFDDFNKAINLKPNYADAYNYRGGIYLMYGYKELGCHDAQKACELGNCEIFKVAKGKGYCR